MALQPKIFLKSIRKNIFENPPKPPFSTEKEKDEEFQV